jgi:hypothetical protein
MIPILTLLLVTALSLLLTRVSAMALMLTGLSSEAARFQARSALSGVGFTTHESEAVMTHPVRRRIMMLLMLLGNLGIATVLASAVISTVTTSRSNLWWLNALVFLVGIAGLIALSQNRWVETRLNRVIARGLRRWTSLEAQDYVALLHLRDGFAVTEMLVGEEDWLAGLTLAEAALPEEGVLALGIQRGSGEYIGTPCGRDTIGAGDTVVLYGPMRRLNELDQRACGEEGFLAHCAAVDEIGRAAPQRPPG